MFYGFHHLFLAIFLLQFSKNGLIPMPQVHEKRLPRKQNEEVWGKLTHKKVKTKNEMSNSNFGFRNVFSVWTLIRLMDISWQNRTLDLAKCYISKPNRTLHEHCCCTFRKSRQICQITPTFLRKHAWYVPEFMRDMCTAVHSKQLIFNF